MKGVNKMNLNRFLPYKEAQEMVQKAGIKTSLEYRNWQDDFNNVPSEPSKVYKKDWKGWGEFLGTKTVSSKAGTFLPYHEAQKIVQKAGIKTSTEFGDWNHPDNIPAAPNRTYKSEWNGWEEFLSTTVDIPLKPIRIIVYVSGGVVQNVLSDRSGIAVMIVDYDNEKVENKERKFENIVVDCEYINKTIQRVEE